MGLRRPPEGTTGEGGEHAPGRTTATPTLYPTCPALCRSHSLFGAKGHTTSPAYRPRKRRPQGAQRGEIKTKVLTHTHTSTTVARPPSQHPHVTTLQYAATPLYPCGLLCFCPQCLVPPPNNRQGITRLTTHNRTHPNHASDTVVRGGGKAIFCPQGTPPPVDAGSPSHL